LKGKKQLASIILAIAVAAAIVAVATTTIMSLIIQRVVNAQTTTSGGAAAVNGEAVKVQAGGGNNTNVIIQFIPQRVEIKTGQSVSWYNPTSVGEPHTVTFAIDNKTMTNVVGPFAVPNSTEFVALPPGSNNEALKVPGKNNVVIAFNARSFVPTVIDSSGTAKEFAPNAVYSVTGTEKYINSGWLLPKGQEQGFPGASNTFTLTFQRPGTYNYSCEVHPWMYGSVVVSITLIMRNGVAMPRII
jgi:plastocyanin